jgi:hypothetical protein
MSDFPENHSSGNWRPIIRETDSDSSSDSSSSGIVSPKGAKFKEERTYSKVSKVSCNVSPTFGFDTKWSTRFLDRELHVKDLPPWCQNHGKGGVHAHDTIRPAIRKKIPTQVKVSTLQPRNWERLRIFAILTCRILVLYASSV